MNEVLSSIGLATLFYLLLQAVKPIWNYITSSNNIMLVFWCVLFIVGGTYAIGYGQQHEDKAFLYSGIGSLASGFVVLFLYWIRKWIKWCHNEKE